MNLDHVSASVQAFKLKSEFHRLRNTLLQAEFVDRMDRPLGYWALPVDRRLPLALLGRTIRELLDTPFEELSATPGIGQKKIGTFVELLGRATNHVPPGSSPAKPTDLRARERPSRSASVFDPSTVSEALWEQWRDTIQRHGLGRERLGRLAPSLQSLPTVIWNTPLSEYAGLTVAEIRSMKTHGEKRTRTILEVFCSVHLALSHTPVQGHLDVRLAPRLIVDVERGIAQCFETANVPSRNELRDRVVRPLLEQLRLDVSPAVAKLVEGRLGVAGERQPVRHQSRRLGVTRARVYQLFEICAAAMAVRWPEGSFRLRSLHEQLKRQSAPADRIDLVRATINIFFPGADATDEGNNGQAS